MLARLKRVVRFSAATAALVTSFLTSAQNAYPTKPILMMTTASPSSGTYFLARLFADKLMQRLGQPVIVESRTGAGGTIATAALAALPADGYSMLMLTSAHAANPFIYSKLPYDTLKDFSGVAMVAESPVLALVHAGLGLKTLNDVVEYAKKNPGKLAYPSAGVGSATHLSVAEFNAMAKISMNHVPYKDNSNLILDLSEGRTQFAFMPVRFMLSQVKEGKLIALAISSTTPITDPVSVPTVKEATGIPYSFTYWSGIVMSSKTPPEIMDRVASAVTQVLSDPDVKAQYKTEGFDEHLLLRKDFDAYIKSEMGQVGPIIKASGVTTN